MGNRSSNKKNVSRTNKIINPGDLIKVSVTAAHSTVFWFITEDNDVKACMMPGPVMAMYIGLWENKMLNGADEWHKILFDNRILLAHVNQIRKIKI